MGELPVERAGELADVATLGIAGGDVAGGDGALVVGGVVSGAAADVDHRRAAGGYGVVGAGVDAAAAPGAEVGIIRAFRILGVF